MDRSVGRIVGALDALKLRERTLILFLGDNGTPQRMIARAEDDQLVRVPVVSWQAGREVPGGKGTLRDAGTRVPLIANWSDTAAGGQVVDDLVDVSDFWPTLLDLAGVSRPRTHEIDGVSLADRLTKNVPAARKWAYAQGRNARWLRTQAWKLYEDGRLFDMYADPMETAAIHNVDDSAAQRRARQMLEAGFQRLAPTP